MPLCHLCGHGILENKRKSGRDFPKWVSEESYQCNKRLAVLVYANYHNCAQLKGLFTWRWGHQIGEVTCDG